LQVEWLCNGRRSVLGYMRRAGWVERLSGGQEGFDSFVSEDEQRSHALSLVGSGSYPARVTDPADDLFAAEFLQIIAA
jgi:hypothetical protein